MTKAEYLKNPCRALSIPYHKNRNIKVPTNMKIIHQNDYDNKKYLNYIDELYFRLIHNLNNVDSADLSQNFYLKTIDLEQDIDQLIRTINVSYEKNRVNKKQILGYVKNNTYDKDLWIGIYNKENKQMVASAIGEIDKELKEGILEWVQVIPDCQKKGLGKVLVNELLLRLTKKCKFVTVAGKIDNPTNPKILYEKCGFIGEDVWHILTKQN